MKMQKRKIILTILLILTIGLITLVKIILKKEIESTENARLGFYSSHIELQKSNTLINFNLVGGVIKTLIYNQIETNTETHSSKYEAINNNLQVFRSTISDHYKSTGLISIKFFVNDYDASHSAPHNDSLIQYIHKSFSINNNPLAKIEGIVYDNNFTYYAIFIPLVNGFNYLGTIEIGFDINMLTNDIAQSLPITNSSIFYKSSNHEIITLNEATDHSTKIPPLHQILADNTAHQSNLQTTSSYSQLSEQSQVLSIVAIDMLYPKGTAYLAVCNSDYLMDKAKEMNNAIFIINLFIILFVMGGFAFTIINRLKVVKEKREIQLSEYRLKELNESKDKFFSIVAHDLKNPFNGIMGLSGYLISDYENVDEAERKEIINDINLASKNAFNLLQNLLEWTRAQSGTIKNNPVIIEPRRIVDLALETVTNLAKNKDITIVEKFNTEARGYADENLIATVIRNLVTNAIKFSPRGKIIEIIANYYQDELYFVVKDQGIGLSSDEIDKLFRIDINFHKRGTEKETGTGLGLKLCKEFVEYCKGRVWVVSELGKGSSFFFTIPLYKK
jgi:signal transduction histidine kinase